MVNVCIDIGGTFTHFVVLYDEGKIEGAIIVAPKGVYKNWIEQEIPTHLPEHIDCRTFQFH